MPCPKFNSHTNCVTCSEERMERTGNSGCAMNDPLLEDDYLGVRK